MHYSTQTLSLVRELLDEGLTPGQRASLWSYLVMKALVEEKGVASRQPRGKTSLSLASRAVPPRRALAS